MADILVNEGTQSPVKTDLVGTSNFQVVKVDVGAAGLTSAFTGTLGAVTNLAGGSVKITTGTLAGGTLTALGIGTIAVGTVLSIGLRHEDEFATVVSGTGTATGTVKAAVSGSQIFVTCLVISAGTGDTNIGLSSGTPTSNNVLGTCTFGSSGGIALTPINPPLRTTSGSALVWSQSGTSNVRVTATGYVD